MIYLKSYRLWIFLVYVTAVICLSLTPGTRFNIFSGMWQYDKIIHFIEYFGLGFLLVNLVLLAKLDKKKKIYLVLFLIFFPIFDEFIQFYTPYRISDINDCIVDVIGGFCGSYVRLYKNN